MLIKKGRFFSEKKSRCALGSDQKGRVSRDKGYICKGRKGVAVFHYLDTFFQPFFIPLFLTVSSGRLVPLLVSSMVY